MPTGPVTSLRSPSTVRRCYFVPTASLAPAEGERLLLLSRLLDVGSEPAELVTSGPDFEAITSTVKAKYGLMVPISRLLDSVRHLGKGPFPYADTGVVITLQG